MFVQAPPRNISKPAMVATVSYRGYFVSSYLQQMRDDPLDPLVGPHVVEQIHLSTGLDPRG